MRLFNNLVYNVKSNNCLFRNLSMRDIREAIRVSYEEDLDIHEALERISYYVGDYSKKERDMMNKMIATDKIDKEEAINRIEALRSIYGEDTEWKNNEEIDIKKVSYSNGRNSIIFW